MTSSSSYSLVDVKPLSSSIGAEIHGIDLNKAISEEQFIEVSLRLVNME